MNVLGRKAFNMTFTSNFGELFNNLLLCFTLGDGANKQTVVGDGYTNTDLLTGANLMIITLKRREKCGNNLTPLNG